MRGWSCRAASRTPDPTFYESEGPVVAVAGRPDGVFLVAWRDALDLKPILWVRTFDGTGRGRTPLSAAWPFRGPGLADEPGRLLRRGARGDFTEETGTFWFFGPDNIELAVKVLDGRTYNGKYWVFYGALTNVEYTIRVYHPAARTERIYHNPPFQFRSHSDIDAFELP